MTIKEFFRAFLGDYDNINIHDYIGRPNAIGADLEENYNVFHYEKYKYIPSEFRDRKVEYFTVESGDYGIEIDIYMERQ